MFITTTGNAQNISQPNHIARANQIIKTIVPEKKITIYEHGIVIDEITLHYSEEKEELPILSISEENEEVYLHVCCTALIRFENEEALEGEITQLVTWTYPIKPFQLSLAKELKLLIDKIKTSHH